MGLCPAHAHCSGGHNYSLTDSQGKRLPRGIGTLHIEGDRVRITGVGGNTLSHVQNVFPADAWLDLETGEAAINRGYYERGRRPPDGTLIEAPYTPPAYLDKIQEQVEPYKKAKEQMLDVVRDLSPRPISRTNQFESEGSFVINQPRNNAVEIAMHLWLLDRERHTWDDNRPPPLHSRTGMMRLSADNGLSLSEPLKDVYYKAALFQNRLVTMTSDFREDNFFSLVDIETEEVLVTRHYRPKPGNNYYRRTFITSAGLVGLPEDHKIEYFDSADNNGPRWTFQAAENTYIYVVGESEDGSRLILIRDRSRQEPRPELRYENVILDTSDGDVLTRIESEGFLGGCGAAFDPPLEHVSFVNNRVSRQRTLQTYRVDTGELTESLPLKQGLPRTNLRNIEDYKTFLTTFDLSKAFDRYAISSQHLKSVQKVTAKGRPAWLVVGERTAHLFAVEDSTHLAAYPYAPERHPDEHWYQPRVGTLFGDRALIVPQPHEPGFDLIDLETLDPALHVRIVPLIEAAGWIAYTPDGLWDASLDAEDYITMYPVDSTAMFSEKDMARYRQPDHIAEVIKQLAN